MEIEIKKNGTWFHGSNTKLNRLKEGSTITQWQALAEAFSHKPRRLAYDNDGKIWHDGTEYGYLYIIDEPIKDGIDIYQHPRTSMDQNAEFLTKRELKLKLVKELPMDN